MTEPKFISRRFTVVTAGAIAEPSIDVIAHRVDVSEAGALVFYVNGFELLRAFAPGTWVDVVDNGVVR